MQQADLGLGDGAWGHHRDEIEYDRKILTFENLNIVSDEVLSDFHRLPSKLTFAQGERVPETEGQ